MRKYQMRHYFTMDVPLLNASLSVFRTLLEQELPDIAKHLVNKTQKYNRTKLSY